jgi:hypothetical protein
MRHDNMALQGGDRPLSRPVPVGLGQRLAALGAAARGEAKPTVDTVAVALGALVNLALGQREAHGALQGVGHIMSEQERGNTLWQHGSVRVGVAMGVAGCKSTF